MFMDWVHCNQCFRREGIHLAVSSCGHIVCESCMNSSNWCIMVSLCTEQCAVCGASCSYLPISEKMKPQEQVYFHDPVKLVQSRLEHISQIAVFQSRQKERVAAYFKEKSMEQERRLKEVMEQSHRELSELKRENAELKKPLSQRRVSAGNLQTNSFNRMSRPVAITPPVTPRHHYNVSYSASGGSLQRSQGPHQGPMTTPGSASSVSTPSSLRDPGFWTPARSVGTAHR
ncbi:RING finger protein 212B-like [Scleropages formosus]|uniref:RING finger protein 212B-like n=1 Tax=Scleropages formosus TaxID=113540 RepID=UPI0010FACCAB|nr:RING finger protein 212B [Scleropages formosus]